MGLLLSISGVWCLHIYYVLGDFFNLSFVGFVGLLDSVDLYLLYVLENFLLIWPLTHFLFSLSFGALIKLFRSFHSTPLSPFVSVTALLRYSSHAIQYLSVIS